VTDANGAIVGRTSFGEAIFGGPVVLDSEKHMLQIFCLSSPPFWLSSLRRSRCSRSTSPVRCRRVYGRRDRGHGSRRCYDHREKRGRHMVPEVRLHGC
jgi:hypothetical protein